MVAVLRPYWNCLKYLNDEDSIELKEYLENWDKNHRAAINFYSYENPPSQFALEGFYPLYPEEENMILDKEIDDLIKKTDLYVPNNRTCFAITEDEKKYFYSNDLLEFKVIYKNNENVKSLQWAVDEICNRKVIIK